MCSRNNNVCLEAPGASQRCPITVGNSICGEANSLDIMNEFNRLYEERMEQVDSDAGGDCLQEKVKLQSEWIKNLIQQNEMLVKAVQELEFEATERVQHLEQKLQKSAESLCEGEKMLNEKDRTLQELTQRVNYYNTFGDVEALAQELQSRRIECDTLKQEMIDMRQALTEEVASKYDQIILLRKDVQVLEDRCLQADKQTAFKEDIIRELRREIKQLKQQVSIPEKPLNLTQKSLIQKHTQVSQTKIEKILSEENHKPYIIVNHSSKKEQGKNTIIYITKEGSVHKEVNFDQNTVVSSQSKNHPDVCFKCKSKLMTAKVQHFPICKSESELMLVNAKNLLKPVKPRSKFTLGETKRILNEFALEELYARGDK